VLIYTICISVFALPFFNFKITFYPRAIIAIAVIHFLVDFAKIKIFKIEREGLITKNLKKFNFCYDQILHIIIVIVAVIFIYHASDNKIVLNSLGDSIKEIYNSMGFNNYIIAHYFIAMLFAFMLILKPANIIIRELNHKQNDGFLIKNKPAGRNIGILERIIIFVLIIVQQYTAIVVVFTVKTITRYDKIST